MATTTATNSSQASPSPFPALLAGFPSRAFQTNNNPAISASPSSTPISSTSTTSNSGVFPGSFNPQYYAAFMQSQMMQQFMKQYINGIALPDTNSNVESRSPSTTNASPSFGLQQKKLLVDTDGNIKCPICDQKVGSDSWSSHLELERSSLAKSIESLKENKRPNTLEVDADNLVSEARQKREFELSRIRLNQQKRLNMKQTLLISSSLHNSPTPQSNTAKFMVSSMCSNVDQLKTPPHLDDTERNFCKSCKRVHEFLVIASGLDEPRCMDCFRKFRRQVGALPLTITESPTDDSILDSTSIGKSRSLSQRNGSHTTSSASPDNLEGPIKRELSPLNNDEIEVKRARMNFVENE